MIPKLIHLCWFSKKPYPVEIRVCVESWARVLPDYEVRLWTEADARAIGLPFINEALDEQRWAFAADAVRIYAVYTEGGIYMDSDIMLYKRFDEFIPETEDDIFVTFCDETIQDPLSPRRGKFGLQAAFFIGTKGNTFCSELLDYYRAHHYRRPDGTLDNTTAPTIMRDLAYKHGWTMEDRLHELELLRVYPTHYLAPCKKYKADSETFGRHQVYGAWRKCKFGRRIELCFNHTRNVVRYSLFKR